MKLQHKINHGWAPPPHRCAQTRSTSDTRRKSRPPSARPRRLGAARRRPWPARSAACRRSPTPDARTAVDDLRAEVERRYAELRELEIQMRSAPGYRPRTAATSGSPPLNHPERNATVKGEHGTRPTAAARWPRSSSAPPRRKTADRLARELADVTARRETEAGALRRTRRGAEAAGRRIISPRGRAGRSQQPAARRTGPGTLSPRHRTEGRYQSMRAIADLPTTVRHEQRGRGNSCTAPICRRRRGAVHEADGRHARPWRNPGDPARARTARRRGPHKRRLRRRPGGSPFARGVKSGNGAPDGGTGY